MTIDKDYDAAKIVKNIIDNNWSEPPTKPRTIEIATDLQKSRDNNRESLLFAETGNRTHNYEQYIDSAAEDSTVSCNAEFVTGKSRSRREEVYNKIHNIVLDNRNNPHSDWDYMTIETNTINDNIYGYYIIECEFKLHSLGDVI